LKGIDNMNMPADGAEKPCPKEGCGGTLTFQVKTPVPGTGGAFVKEGRGVFTEPRAEPGWSCSRCNYIEWISK